MMRRACGTGTVHKAGYILKTYDGRQRLEHIAVAEAALGKPLPPGAEVHHVDENKANNSPSNLVICPDSAYHKLLHQRMRARDACGNPNWLKCHICKTYDDPANLSHHGYQNIYHAPCNAQRQRALRIQRKEKSHVHD